MALLNTFEDQSMADLQKFEHFETLAVILLAESQHSSGQDKINYHIRSQKLYCFVNYIDKKIN